MRTSTKYIFLFLSFICSGTIQSQIIKQSAKPDSIILGNGQRKVVSYENIYNENQMGGSALYYPESTMQMFKECRINDIYVAVDDFKSAESVQIFISHSLEEPYDYTQSVTLTKNGWSKITLDTPFKPDGSSVYIGYITKGRSLCYTEVKEENEEWINQRDNKWTKSANRYSAALYAVVKEGDKLPSFNARVKKMKMPYYAQTNVPVKFSGKISNLGIETIHSFEVTYQVGENQYKETVADVNIPSQSEIDFQTSGLKLTNEGEFDLTFLVTAVNGKPDQNMADNYSRTVKLLSRNKFVDRKILLEVFSTEKCNNCPDAHKMLAKKLENNDRVIELGHHSGFYEDKLTIDASREYIWFYKTDRLHAPAQMLDRTNMYDNYPEFFEPETPVIGVSEKSFDLTFNEAMNTPAFATVNLSAERVGESGRNLKISVDGKGILPISGGVNDRLYVFLTEDSIFSETQSGSAKGFYHNHTARLCLTNLWGDAINLANGYEADYTVEIPEEWNADQMHAIAFVGNYDAANKNNCSVYNAESITLKSLLPSGITNAHVTTPSIIQKGSTICIPGGYTSVRVYTLDGKCIINDSESKEFLHLAQLPKGIYVLHANKGGLYSVLKINL